jgi:hypothetical protein
MAKELFDWPNDVLSQETLTTLVARDSLGRPAIGCHPLPIPFSEPSQYLLKAYTIIMFSESVYFSVTTPHDRHGPPESS